MMHDKTAAPIPPVGADGEQPMFKETIGSIAETFREIKCSNSSGQEHPAGGSSSAGPAQTCFLSSASKLPSYIQYPRFMLDMPVSETAMLVYMVLLDRARLSMKKAEWTDEQGRVFIHFPVKKLAETLHKGETTVKTALVTLERAALITRENQGVGKPSLIYVRIPVVGKLSAPESENCPPHGQNSDCHGGGKLSGSKNNIVRTISKNEESKSEPTAYGPHNNVFLTDEEYLCLIRRIRSPQAAIRHLSNYMYRNGRTYSDHLATLLDWAEKDGNLIPERNYDCQEGESL